MMNILLLTVCLGLATKSVGAFSYQALPSGVVNLSSSAQRDVYTMADWASSYGVQQAEGLQLTSYDGQDYFAATQQDIAAGTCVMYVPNDIILSSVQAVQEFGGTLYDAENQLQMAGLQEKIPLFRLFMKILHEYEKGQESPWYTWLDSLPRIYNTGASMTYACFDCLPPYAVWLALSERQNFVNFQKAAKFTSLNEEILSNVTVLKWAYNVALTRSQVSGMSLCFFATCVKMHHIPTVCANRILKRMPIKRNGMENDTLRQWQTCSITEQKQRQRLATTKMVTAWYTRQLTSMREDL